MFDKLFKNWFEIGFLIHNQKFRTSVPANNCFELTGVIHVDGVDISYVERILGKLEHTFWYHLSFNSKNIVSWIKTSFCTLPYEQRMVHDYDKVAKHILYFDMASPIVIHHRCRYLDNTLFHFSFQIYSIWVETILDILWKLELDLDHFVELAWVRLLQIRSSWLK